jgi:hypothetical protein
VGFNQGSAKVASLLRLATYLEGETELGSAKVASLLRLATYLVGKHEKGGIMIVFFRW